MVIYGHNGTIHGSQLLNVEVDQKGRVVSVWFRYMALPFVDIDWGQKQEHHFGIGWAIKEMQNGAKVARAGWNGKGMFLYYVPYHFESGLHSKGTEDTHHQPFIMMHTVQKTEVPWLASQTDLLAVDWEIVQ